MHQLTIKDVVRHRAACDESRVWPTWPRVHLASPRHLLRAEAYLVEWQGASSGWSSTSQVVASALPEGDPVADRIKLKPPPTVATIGGSSRSVVPEWPAPDHAAGRISPPAGGAPPGAGLAEPLRGVASTLLALSHAARSSPSFMKR